MAIASRSLIRLAGMVGCIAGPGISESLLEELHRRATYEGLAFVEVRGEPVWILKADGEWITPRNPRDLSSAWPSKDGATTVWNLINFQKQSPWFCPTPLIIESLSGVQNWRLPGDVINVRTARASPDGKSVAFFGTYKPPDSGMLNGTNDQSKWVTGLMYSSRGTGVNVVFTTPTRTLPEYPIGSISWSPDGRAFVYDYEGKIHIFDLSAKSSRVITSGSNPDWSPDGRWIAFRSQDGLAYAVDPVTERSQDLFGHRPIMAGVRWSPDSRYVMFDEKLGFLSSLLSFHNPFFTTGVTRVVRLEDGDSVPINWIDAEGPNYSGFDWVSDYRTFLQRAAVKPIVQSCQRAGRQVVRPLTIGVNRSVLRHIYTCPSSPGPPSALNTSTAS